MAIERLLGDVGRDVFLEQYFLRLPFSLPDAAQPLCNLATWDTIDAFLANPAADVMIVKEGRRWEEARTPSPAEARSLHEDGYTLLVRHAERHDEQIAELAAGFERDFRAPVDVHLYCTPPSEHGFGWHYDAEDVFIIQTAGDKEYSLRKNTVNPWPLLENLPADMRYEREQMPLMQCTLRGGDWLYIPHGYWHVARAKSSAISLAIGVLSPAAIDVVDHLRKRLTDEIFWRRRLPPVGDAVLADNTALVQQYRELFAELGDELARVCCDEGTLRSYLAARGVSID